MVSNIQLRYYAWDLTHKKSVSDDTRFTGVLAEANVDMNPHQIEAALFAFKSPLSKGAIIADEVGLGKTIEAGIILSEFWAEHKRRILIVVPASLRNQWNIELLEKFYLPSTILGGSSNVETEIEEGIRNTNILICSYHFASNYAEYLKSCSWDLVVFDEAHKLRNVFKKSNIMANTIRKSFQDYKKILLTATPLQNNLKELYGLISIIDPEYFSSVDTFAKQYNSISTRDKSTYGELKDRLSHIIHRTLRNQVQEYVKFTKRTAFVQEYYPSQQELSLYHKISSYLQREGTFGVPERQRPLLSLLVRKIMSSSAYALSFTLEQFINRLNIYKKTGNLMSVLSVLASEIDSVDEEYSYEELDPKDAVSKDIDKEIKELEQYRDLARQIKEESKAYKLLDALSLSFDKIKALGGERKALIFTESRHTQDYLKTYLEGHGYENKVVCFNGTNNSEDTNMIYRLWLQQYAGTSRVSGSTAIDKKQAIVDYFCNNAEIMIATEAGAEGINLQFCSLVVNYDMPWNPQRIEQRIGRCHRYGQKNDVVVVNFVNRSNYADCRVYQLLDSKFSLFDGVFGASDEVLGAMDSGISFEQRLNKIYQTCRTEREISAAFDELQQELDDLIKERINETKKTLLEHFDEDVVKKLRIRQSKDSYHVNTYQSHFWKLAKSILKEEVTDIDESKYSFKLSKGLGDDILPGVYALNKDANNCKQLRFSSPLGQYILNKASELPISDASLTFDLTNYPYRSAILEQFKEKQGYAILYRISSSNKFDSEEQIIACAMTSDGEKLPNEFVTKLLELNATTERDITLDNITDKFKEAIEEEARIYKLKVDEETNKYVDYEINKYEMWADDQLVPLENEIIELNKEYEEIRKQIRKEHQASQKLQLKVEETKLSKRLKAKRQQLSDLQEEYMDKVDEMTERLQESMNNQFELTPFLKFHWSMV